MDSRLRGFVEVPKAQWYSALKAGGIGKQDGNLRNSYSINASGQMYRHTSPAHKEVMIKLGTSGVVRYYIKSSGLKGIYE